MQRPDIDVQFTLSHTALLILKMVLVEAEGNFLQQGHAKYACMLGFVRDQLPNQPVPPAVPPRAHLN